MAKRTPEPVAATIPSPSDAYLARVTHVVAYESARLGRDSGSITASLIGVIITGRAWSLPSSDKLSLDAYVEAGGAEGTYRVARRMAGLVCKPTVPQKGDVTFAKSLITAHALDTPTLEIAAVTAAYIAYKGKQGWQKFSDALSGKANDAKAPKAPKINTVAKSAVEAALEDGGNASPARAEETSEQIASVTSGGVEGIVMTYIRECSTLQLEAVQTAINARMVAMSAAIKVAQAA